MTFKSGNLALNPSTGDRPQSLWLISAGIYATLFGLTLWLAYTNQLPDWFRDIPYYDKIGHVSLYAIATYLGHRLLRSRYLQLHRWRLPLFPALFGCFTVTEELLQGLSPYRTLDALDLVCSGLGIALGYWLVERKRAV